MTGQKFEIYLLGFKGREASGDTIRDMMRVFRIDEAVARHVVTHLPMVVKQNLTAADAQAFFSALRGIGAEVKILESIGAPPSSQSVPTAQVLPSPASPGPSPSPQPGPTPTVPVTPKAAPSPAAPVTPKAAPSPAAPVSPKAVPSPAAPVSPKPMAKPPPDPGSSPLPTGLEPTIQIQSPVLATPGAAPPVAKPAASSPVSARAAPPVAKPAASLPLSAGAEQPFVEPAGFSLITDGAEQPVVEPDESPPASAETGPPVTAPVPDRLQSDGGFANVLLGAFTYPLQKPAIIPFVVVPLIYNLLIHAPFLKLVTILLGYGLLLWYLFSVIRLSSLGIDEIPSYRGEGSNLQNLLRAPLEFLEFNVALWLPFAGLLVLCFASPHNAFWAFPVSLIAALAAMGYLPASVILVANDIRISPSALRTGFRMIFFLPGPYFLTLSACVCCVVASWLVILIVRLTGIPYVSSFMAAVIGFYLQVVASRMLGLFAFHHLDRFNLKPDLKDRTEDDPGADVL